MCYRVRLRSALNPEDRPVATVTLLQPTDMTAFPITASVVGRGYPSEYDLFTDKEVTFHFLGSFDLSNSYNSGVIFRAMIHDQDSGGVPNLDVTGLSYTASDMFYLGSNPADTLSKLLAGDDTIIGTSGPDVIDGFLGFDIINGGGGDDFIFGRDGGGILRGGDGNTASMVACRTTSSTAESGTTSCASEMATTLPMARMV